MNLDQSLSLGSILLVGGVFTGIFTACLSTSRDETFRLPSSETAEPPLEFGEIWGTDERNLAQIALSKSIDILRAARVDGDIFRRDAHPKHHGCVKATWTPVAAKLQPGQEVGIFKNPRSTFPAWIRFSNGNSKGFQVHDQDSDVRGMAIKLMKVPNSSSGTQDFLLMTSPRFFSRDAEDYHDLLQAVTSGRLSLIAYFVMNPTNAFILNGASVKIDNPLSVTYSGPVPIRIGDKSARVRAIPCEETKERILTADKSNANFLRTALTTTLASSSVCFDFFIQPNQDPQRNIVENPTLRWNEEVSPFIRVARLTIDQQTGVDSPEMMAFCENISFSPWHSQPELRPLGQINRIRRIVYEGVSKYRHEANGVPMMEPTNHDACGGATAPLCRVR